MTTERVKPLGHPFYTGISSLRQKTVVSPENINLLSNYCERMISPEMSLHPTALSSNSHGSAHEDFVSFQFHVLGPKIVLCGGLVMAGTCQILFGYVAHIIGKHVSVTFFMR